MEYFSAGLYACGLQTSLIMHPYISKNKYHAPSIHMYLFINLFPHPMEQFVNSLECARAVLETTTVGKAGVFLPA
jgi:hypothetical protein